MGVGGRPALYHSVTQGACHLNFWRVTVMVTEGQFAATVTVTGMLSCNWGDNNEFCSDSSQPLH